MGTSIPMQELIGMRGEQGDDYIPVARDWLDTSEYKELVTDWLILQNTANTGCPVLTLETAVAAEGPWTTIATFGSGYTHAQVYCTSRETGTNRMERLVRYRIDLANAEDWKSCFRICATLK